MILLLSTLFQGTLAILALPFKAILELFYDFR